MEFVGHIEAICGPMWSGKTTELQRRLSRYSAADHKCLYIRPEVDVRKDRMGALASTHGTSHLTADDKIEVKSYKKLADVAIDGYTVVGIDEGQFFSDLYEMSENWANSGYIVVVALLLGTFTREPFPLSDTYTVGDFLSISDMITSLTAVCQKCKSRDAPFSRRLGASREVVDISNNYMAVCRKCYMIPEDEFVD